MSAGPLKRPMTAYFLFLNANRAKIEAMVGGRDPKKVSTKASEMWKTASPAEKKTFEDQFAADKKKYDEFLKTEEGQKALEEKKGERADKKEAKIKREMKVAAKSVEKDEKLKKPQSAYWMWLGDNRDKINAELKKEGKSCSVSDVGKKAGAMWSSLPAADKGPYEAKAKKTKDEYDAYIKSEAGSAALQQHKDAVSAAKQEVKGAPKPEPESKKSPVKRKASEKKDSEGAVDEGKVEPEEPQKKKAKAKAKGKAAKTTETEQQKNNLDPTILAEADKLGYRTGIENLAGRPEIMAMSLNTKQLLEALKTSGGLVNKAKQQLLLGGA